MHTPVTEEGYFPQIDIKATEDQSFTAYKQGIMERHSSASFYLYLHHYGKERFYVGIGHADRAKRTISYRNHSKKWRLVVQEKGRPTYTIVQSGMTKEEASSAERVLIAKLRRDGVDLVNHHHGGSIPSAEASAKGGWKLMKRAAFLKEGAAWRRRVRALALACFPRINEVQATFAL